jgi:hypothetical protein
MLVGVLTVYRERDVFSLAVEKVSQTRISQLFSVLVVVQGLVALRCNFDASFLVMDKF